MPSPNRKRVSDRVMQAVADAITIIENDPSSPRTKRKIEALTDLSHDAVARAFAQDRDDEKTPYRLTQRFDALTAPLVARGDSLDAAEARAQRQTIAELRQRNRDLDAMLDRYATALFAQHLDQQEARPELENVASIRRTRRVD